MITKYYKTEWIEKENNNMLGKKTPQSGYKSISANTELESEYAIKNYATAYGLTKYTTITKEEYEK